MAPDGLLGSLTVQICRPCLCTSPVAGHWSCTEGSSSPTPSLSLHILQGGTSRVALSSHKGSLQAASTSILRQVGEGLQLLQTETSWKDLIPVTKHGQVSHC